MEMVKERKIILFDIELGFFFSFPDSVTPLKRNIEVCYGRLRVSERNLLLHLEKYTKHFQISKLLLHVNCQ